MSHSPKAPDQTARSLRWPLAATRAGLVAERLLRAFWPLWTLAVTLAAVVFLGVHESLPVEAVWIAAAVAVPALLALMVLGLRRFRWPSRRDTADRLDATLPGRPIAALADSQAIGTGDPASQAVWDAHRGRMRSRIVGARRVRPDLRLARFDPFGLRYVALTLLAVSLLFGSIWRVEGLAGMGPGPAQALSGGPSWEGWIEPPAYTGRPAVYLNDVAGDEIAVPEGSEVILRLYGAPGALSVAEDVSGGTAPAGPDGARATSQSFTATRSGQIAIDGPGGDAWSLRLIGDAAPRIEVGAPLTVGADGEMAQPYSARDDYGVVAARARITLDLSQLDRRHGLAVEPDPREPIVVDLPLPITGDRQDFSETMIENFSKHPWSGLPVRLGLLAEDAAGSIGESPRERMEALPGRRFFDPLASAIIEQRRDLLWSSENAPRVARLLRAASHRPEGFFRSETNYLRMRVAIRRLETANEYGLTEEMRDEVAEALWDLALKIEEGDLANALERLRRAQDRLSEAMRDGASDEEIAELMRELREAMQDYMRQLAEQGQQDGEELADQNMQEMSGQQLQEMLDELQRLMEEGRMAEAEQLLDRLRQMMENMRVAEGQQGGQTSPGQQAMRGLQETLRDQQGLSDEAFRDLQEQFNDQPGQQGQQGAPGQQGQGQQGQGQQGQGQQGQGARPGQPQGPGGQPGQGLDGESLADRQERLRELLEGQRRGLPGAGEAAEAAREALDRAGRAMDGAEQALREDDLAGALDQQSEAMDAIREGMQHLGEELAQQEQGQGQQGEAYGEANPGARRDPLGRQTGSDGQLGTAENLLQGEDVYRRARDLLDEIRRRAGDQTRSAEELDYLRRLLDRF